MEIKTLLLPITGLPAGFPHGYANGYIGVPRDHPWHGKDCDEIDRIVTIHGGLTYGRDRTPLGEPDGNWWLGFDTCHLNENEFTCDQAYCEVQVEFLKQQAIEAHDPLI